MRNAQKPHALLFSCSGAANTGEIADRAARQLRTDGVGKVVCLASVSARNENLDAVAAAPAILAIDGCPKGCATKTLALAGITQVRSLCVTDLGFGKWEADPNEAAIRAVADRGKEILSENPQ